MPKVLVVDDHPMIVHAVEALVHEVAPRVAVMQSKTLAQTLALCRDSQDIALILLDLNLPDSRHTEGLTVLHEEFPRIPIVVFTGQEHSSVRTACLRAGASAYVMKSGDRGALSDALERFLGEFTASGEPQGARRETLLSSRQLDVLRLLVTGSTTREIAQALNIGEATVKTHIKTIYSRADCRNRVELSHWYSQTMLHLA